METKLSPKSRKNKTTQILLDAVNVLVDKMKVSLLAEENISFPRTNSKEIGSYQSYLEILGKFTVILTKLYKLKEEKKPKSRPKIVGQRLIYQKDEEVLKRYITETIATKYHTINDNPPNKATKF